MSVANLPMDQFINILVMAGLPAIIGTFVSGVIQMLKISPNIPYIEEGKTWAIRGILALSCLLVQIIFNAIHRDPITLSIIGQTFLNYFAATTAYAHFFKVNNAQ